MAASAERSPHFGEFFKQRLKEQGYPQKTLAENWGVNPSQVTHFLKRADPPPRMEPSKVNALLTAARLNVGADLNWSTETPWSAPKWLDLLRKYLPPAPGLTGVGLLVDAVNTPPPLTVLGSQHTPLPAPPLPSFSLPGALPQPPPPVRGLPPPPGAHHTPAPRRLAQHTFSVSLDNLEIKLTITDTTGNRRRRANVAEALHRAINRVLTDLPEAAEDE